MTKIMEKYEIATSGLEKFNNKVFMKTQEKPQEPNINYQPEP